MKQSQATDILTQYGFRTSDTAHPSSTCLLAISVDRTERSPCIIASPSVDPKGMAALSRKFPFAYGSGGATADAMLENISLHLDIRGRAQQALFNLISALHGIFMTKEAFVLETKIAITKEGELQVHEARFGLDDAALKTAGRQRDIHAFRDKASETFEEVEAEKSGMIYVKLDGKGSLGTIVNGAGLAMNTVDSLKHSGGHPANFLEGPHLIQSSQLSGLSAQIRGSK